MKLLFKFIVLLFLLLGLPQENKPLNFVDIKDSLIHGTIKFILIKPLQIYFLKKLIYHRFYNPNSKKEIKKIFEKLYEENKDITPLELYD